MLHSLMQDNLRTLSMLAESLSLLDMLVRMKYVYAQYNACIHDTCSTFSVVPVPFQ
jgi:hypothetical protein